MTVVNRDEADLPELILGETPALWMTQYGVAIRGEGAVAAALDGAMGHSDSAPGRMTVSTVCDVGVAPPAMFPSVMAVRAVFHIGLYTDSAVRSA